MSVLYEYEQMNGNIVFVQKSSDRISETQNQDDESDMYYIMQTTGIITVIGLVQMKQMLSIEC